MWLASLYRVDPFGEREAHVDVEIFGLRGVWCRGITGKLCSPDLRANSRSVHASRRAGHWDCLRYRLRRGSERDRLGWHVRHLSDVKRRGDHYVAHIAYFCGARWPIGSRPPFNGDADQFLPGGGHHLVSRSTTTQATPHNWTHTASLAPLHRAKIIPEEPRKPKISTLSSRHLRAMRRPLTL